jgi:hypothetical protein
MIAKYKCLSCGALFESKTPTSCISCNHNYVQWLNYQDCREEWKAVKLISAKTIKEFKAVEFKFDDGQEFYAPFSWFKTNEYGVDPEFDDIEVIDGDMVRLGGYYAEASFIYNNKENKICPICGREMIENSQSTDRHHLIPKLKGGRKTYLLHKICHRKLHSIWSENELRDTFNSWEEIRSDERIKDFSKWVSKKDPTYVDSHKISNTHKKKRRR